MAHSHHHTHDCCAHSGVSALLSCVEKACKERGLRLTPARADVLKVLARSQAPMGAYDIIEAMAAEGQPRPAPTIIYRALEFLQANGFVHRIESRNAYLACDHTHAEADVVVFLLCDRCGAAIETGGTTIGEGLAALAKAAGFQARAQVVELAGLCAGCHVGSK